MDKEIKKPKLCFFTIDESWLKKVRKGHLHYLSCSENASVLRIKDRKMVSKNLSKWEMNMMSQGSEILTQSSWVALAAAGPEPAHCSRSTFSLL